MSYNRPLETRHYRAVNTVFNVEYPFVRFLEANGYDVSYTTGVDSDTRGELIANYRLFLSLGHDEYWSGRQRRNVEAARDVGVHLAFFSGNKVFRKTRFEPSIDGSEEPHWTLVTYKETHANAKIDPVPDVWTGTWRDSRPFNPRRGKKLLPSLSGASGLDPFPCVWGTPGKKLRSAARHLLTRSADEGQRYAGATRAVERTTRRTTAAWSFPRGRRTPVFNRIGQAPGVARRTACVGFAPCVATTPMTQ